MDCDFLVIGAGIAGASAAAMLPRDTRVIVLERETQPGYHSTGRSAALFSEIYGNAPVRALSRASREFLFAPPPGFSDAALVRPRGVLFFGTADQAAAFAELRLQPDVARDTRVITSDEAQAIVPCLKRDYVAHAIYEAGATDIDANALHAAYLRQLKGNGGQLICGCTIDAIERSGSLWSIHTQLGTFRAPTLINAAGAWADDVAERAGVARVGLSPLRRTALIIDPPAGLTIDHWPLTLSIDETLYFKPDAGRLLVSPADETLSAPCDAQPDDYDVAVAVDRYETVTGTSVERVIHRWAGLRTFAPDRSPVVGFDAKAAGFFWLAGQGGYGLQTAPAMARVAAALASGNKVPAEIEAHGVDALLLAPGRARA